MADPVKDGTSETKVQKSPAAAVRAKAESARQSVNEAYSKTRERASDAYDSARERASAAYGTARERTTAAYDSARKRASQGRARATATLEDNPVAALVGGIALGALVGALLPRGKREAELLGGIGGRISDTTKRVADAARESAREAIDGYGLSADSTIEKVNSLFDSATKAASSIGNAAKDALHKDR